MRGGAFLFLKPLNLDESKEVKLKMNRKIESGKHGASFQECEKALSMATDELMSLPHVAGLGVRPMAQGFGVVVYVEPSGNATDSPHLPSSLGCGRNGVNIPVTPVHMSGPIQLASDSDPKAR